MNDDLRPVLDAALHTLDRLPEALRRCWEDGWSPLAAVRYNRNRVSGSTDSRLPHVGDPTVLGCYLDSVSRLRGAQDTARRLGWPTRAVWKTRTPEPWMVETAIGLLRATVKWPRLLEHEQAGLVRKLCGQIDGAWTVLPESYRRPARQPRGEAKRCVTERCDNKTTQRSDFCSACRKHRTRHGTDRVIGEQGRCVCQVCNKQRRAA